MNAKSNVHSYLYHSELSFHPFKAGLIILKSFLLYSNIHFFLLDNEIFLLASVVTIVRCGFLVGIVKFPSFMFKHNSNIVLILWV